MGATVIRSFVGEVASREFSFDVEIEGGGRRSALLFVQAQVAAKDTSDFTLEVGGEGWSWQALEAETLEGNNRRYRGGGWASAVVPEGVAVIEVRCGRPATVMAFVALVDEPAPVRERRELSVVIRGLEAGETHEVRYVRPEELVMKAGGADGSPGGIDWEKTAFRAHVFTVDGAEL